MRRDIRATGVILVHTAGLDVDAGSLAHVLRWRAGATRPLIIALLGDGCEYESRWSGETKFDLHLPGSTPPNQLELVLSQLLRDWDAWDPALACPAVQTQAKRSTGAKDLATVLHDAP